jgi:biotin synthase
MNLAPNPQAPHRDVRHDWTVADLTALYDAPFADLIYRAQTVHRRHFAANEVQISILLSIKTGGCPEDCGYCPQSAAYETGLKASKLMDKTTVVACARAAKAAGASRFCMGAAWRAPKEKDLDRVCEMICEIRALGLETCVTLGMLTAAQAAKLKAAGLDYYNHNLDTSPDYYGKIVSTRTYQDRLDTLAALRDVGIRVCCGGIVGMGETKADRIGLIHTLATLPQHPESVPINLLMRVKGTKLAESSALDPFDLVRTIALARLTMPASHVRLSAGREHMSDETQALCFLAGANSIFSGDVLLTTENPGVPHDDNLLKRLGMTAMPGHAALAEKMP